MLMVLRFLANISMGPEVRFPVLRKTRLYHLRIFLSVRVYKPQTILVLYYKGFWHLSLWMMTWCFVWQMEAKTGNTAESLLNKSPVHWEEKGKEVTEQWRGGVGVWRSLFLASEKSGVCGQWKRKGSVGKVTWSSAVAFILHDPCESESAARAGGGVEYNKNKYKMAYMAHTKPKHRKDKIAKITVDMEMWTGRDPLPNTLFKCLLGDDFTPDYAPWRLD